MGAHPRIDVESLRASVDLVELVSRYVTLKPDGHEFKACCPFHGERTPSFYVSPRKGFVHCFGCGVHDDAIGFLMRIEGLDFATAAARLGGGDFARAADWVAPAPVVHVPGDTWVPLLPVPDHAPALIGDDGWTVPIFNPKRGRSPRFKPAATYAYRSAAGELLGYVLRCEFPDGKITPQVTWCIGPDGRMQWCIAPFPRPRPLFGLDVLASKAQAPVLLPEGEKCALAGAGALPMYAVLGWPGGGKGVPYVDWTPLAGRDVVLWPDADPAGRQAMLGAADRSGATRYPGVAQMLARVGVRSMRYIDTEGQPRGWDIADALRDGWTARQLATWAAHRVCDLTVRRG